MLLAVTKELMILPILYIHIGDLCRGKKHVIETTQTLKTKTKNKWLEKQQERI